MSPVCPLASHRVGPVLRGMMWKRKVLWRLVWKSIHATCDTFHCKGQSQGLPRIMAEKMTSTSLMWEMVWMHKERRNCWGNVWYYFPQGIRRNYILDVSRYPSFNVVFFFCCWFWQVWGWNVERPRTMNFKSLYQSLCYVVAATAALLIYLKHLYRFSGNKIWLSFIFSDVIADLYLWSESSPFISVNHPLL